MDPRMGRGPFSIQLAPVPSKSHVFLSSCLRSAQPSHCHVHVTSPSMAPTLASGPEARAHVPDRCGEGPACPAQHRRWPTPPLPRLCHSALVPVVSPSLPGSGPRRARPAQGPTLQALSRHSLTPAGTPGWWDTLPPAAISARREESEPGRAGCAQCPRLLCGLGRGCSAPPGDVRRAEPGPAGRA